MKYFITILMVGGLCVSLFSQSNLSFTSTCDFTTICNNSTNCDGAIANLTATATTDCSIGNTLIFSYQIDVDNDNSIDITGSGSTVDDFVPMGDHRVIFTVTDQCNSTESCEYLFKIKDCKTPVPVCIFGIATVVMDASGSITINASTFESGMSYDNCTDYSDLTFSFSEDPNHQIMEIECGDVGSDGLVPLKLYVFDQEGNFDFCATYLGVQDPNGACDGMSTGTNGIRSVTASNNEDMTGVYYDINGIFQTQVDMISTISLNIGDVITPSKNNNPLNGVTTYDIVLIERHILNEDPLDEAWKLTAADVNENGVISSLDIVQMRALILHIVDEYPSGKSWVFDPTFVEYDGTFSSFDFLGIKLGDVNGTAMPMLLTNEMDTRTNENDLIFTTKNKTFQSTETITIPMLSDNFNNVIGNQFTIEFDPDVLEFKSIEGNAELNLNNENFGLTLVDEGIVLCSWHAAEGKNLNPDQAFLTFNFLAKKEGKLSNSLTINSQKITAEVYIETNNEIDLGNVYLNFENEAISTELSVFPNPFFEKTLISFSSEKESEATLSIFDMNGRVIFSQIKNALVGENNWELSKCELPANGVYFLEIKTDRETFSQKIIAF